MKTLLLAEDDPHIRRLVEFALADLDCAIEHHETGDALLARLATPPRPDLVILDVNLPGLSGFDVLRAMKRRADCREVPVLVLSASTLESYREQARALGAAFFPKPFELARFIERVAGLLDPDRRDGDPPPSR